MKTILRMLVVFLGVLILPLVSLSLEKPKWLKDFEEFAQKQGDAELIERARTLSREDALSLAKEWKEYLGYDAPSIVESRASNYPDIKPGIVINGKTYSKYPSLKKLLPEYVLRRLPDGSYAQFGNIMVVPTLHYYPYREYIDVTKRNEGKVKIGKNNDIVNWVAGYPFPHPKSPWEIYYNYDRLGTFSDNLHFAPDIFTMYDRKGRVERTEKMSLQWMFYKGRVKMNPKPIIPGYEDVYEKGSIILEYPYDLKGFAVVRGRFADPNKPDEFISYVPALRRIRRLAGTDTQDPIIGTDISWEDWKGWWQNITAWPMEMKVKEVEVLAPIRLHHTRINVDASGKISGYWEIRPAYLLEQTMKTKNYLYSKRRIWIDKELFSLIHIEMYDVRGNLWRSMLTGFSFSPEGMNTWALADVPDYVNSHRSFMRPNPIVNDPVITKDWFDIKYLIRMAH